MKIQKKKSERERSRCNLIQTVRERGRECDVIKGVFEVKELRGDRQ